MKNHLIALAVSVLLATGIAACGGDANDAADNDTTHAGATTGGADSGTVAADAGTSGDAAAVKEYTFHGTVKKVDTERQMITIDHEKIGDYMEAMTMPFKVADPALLSQVKEGQQTHFTIRVAGDQALITKIEDEHADGAGH
jgi:Cu(I)/Ag(I) efflux system periplasmic protein CusF